MAVNAGANNNSHALPAATWQQLRDSWYAHNDGAVDTRKRLKTTCLCMNRILQEPGLTRVIGGYYKDIMASDAWERMSYILNKLNQADHLNIVIRQMIQELGDYLEYYLDHTWIMTMTMVVLAKCQWSAPQVRATVVLQYFDVFLQATRAHRAQTVLCFVQFLHGNFDDPDTDSRDTTGPFTAWNVRFFERIFDSGAVELPLHMVADIDSYCSLPSYISKPNSPMPGLVASTVRDVVFVLAVYLSNNDSSPQFAAWWQQVSAASRRMQVKVAELQQEDDEEEEDHDDDGEADDRAVREEGRMEGNDEER